jgi:general nucleoside transport system permease protein
MTAVTSRLPRGSRGVAILGIVLGALGLALALPPLQVRTHAVPVVFGLAGLACAVWALSRGERKLGVWAVVVSVAAAAFAIWVQGKSAGSESQVLNAGLVAATLVYATPLAYAALGGIFSERSGVVNIGLEGMMRAGAFFACWAAFATGSAWAGVAAGIAAGATLAAFHAFVSIHGRADQVVSGIALNLVALGLITFLLELVFGTTGVAPAETLPELPTLWGRSLYSYLALAAPFALAGLLRYTVLGLRLQSVGENPRAAATLGVSIARVRWIAVLGGGALAGLGGSALPLAILHRFDNKMPAGMGFMALAAMVFGKWTPLGALAASLFFAFGNAGVDAIKSALPPAGTVASWHLDGILLAAPYLLTLALLAGFVGRAVPPAADGIPFDPEARD